MAKLLNMERRQAPAPQYDGLSFYSSPSRAARSRQVLRAYRQRRGSLRRTRQQGVAQRRISDGTRLIWPTYSVVNRQLVDTLVITTVP